MLYGLRKECSPIYVDYVEYVILCISSVGDFIALMLIPCVIIIVTNKYMNEANTDGRQMHQSRK